MTVEILRISAQEGNYRQNIQVLYPPSGGMSNSQVATRIKLYQEAHDLQQYQLARRQDLELKEMQEQHRRAVQQLRMLQQQQQSELRRRQDEQLAQVQQSMGGRMIQPLAMSRVQMDS